MLFPSHFSRCIQISTTIIPKDWLCETCQSKHDSTSPHKVSQDVGSMSSKRQQSVKRGKVKYLDLDEVIRLSSWKASSGSKNFISKIPSLTPKSNPPISPPKVHGKLPPRNDEVHKKPMTNQHASFSLFQGSVPSDDGKFIMEKDPQSNQKNLNLYRKFLPSSIHAWRGQIQILLTAQSSITFDGFEAQPPCIVNRKAYKFSREMPSVLQVESFPALNVLTDIFPDDSPNLQDIALYFFPSEDTDRFRKNLDNILKFMNDEKAMLRSYIDGVELLVFTSNQLDTDSRGVIAEVNAGHFLWGIFRQNKIDKAIERVPSTEPVDMDIDMIGGKDVVGRIDHIRKDKPKSASVMKCNNKL
ncbi:unnamed protein product [Sphenostylis stenocarpa]|uniref:AIPP2-like SPOC-like domain-containing protein n=1 Tax=Sphenostylis stenocarpa TaxID=92480 RepID=A0AA86TF45_9FABA|nr:unnamed protein product [Sphenostylis stenocarpa]